MLDKLQYECVIAEIRKLIFIESVLDSVELLVLKFLSNLNQNV